MPNGGVPLHMVVRPPQSDLVIHCEEAHLSIYRKTEWDADGTDASPIATLDEAACGGIAWFLQHWIVDKELLQPGYNLPGFEFEY